MTPREAEASAENAFAAGKTFVVTGTLEKWGGKKLKILLRQWAGAHPAASVKKPITLLQAKKQEASLKKPRNSECVF